MPYQISVDTGGTFTDVVVSNDLGQLTVGKSPTTHQRVFEGMRAAMADAAGTIGINLSTLLRETSILTYGTTHSTNSLVEGKVAKTALLVTEGFPDTLVIKEGGKLDAHDFTKDYPEPYIARRHTFEIPERINSEGAVHRPLEIEAARGILARIGQRGFEAVAVALLWSIANPAHEIKLGRLIEEMLPGVPYTLSHQLVAIIREYRRTSATAIDASLKPLMQRHLRQMEMDLRQEGYRGEVLVSTSIGGSMHVNELVERPVHTVQSGPAMAPVAARKYAETEGLGGDVLVCDAGGTTFDVGIVRDGKIKFTRETWLKGQWEGHILGISSIDVRSVGAGGGSIAWLDSGGLLRVGPQSSGSEPGPACYGKGGDQPTVSDAAVVLGYLLPDFFLGGRMPLDVEAAHRVIGALGARMQMLPQRAAFAVMTLANEHMIKAIHTITISEGLNPRECALVAGGGAAGLGIAQIAREMGARQVLLPRTAGALSASGMQFADIVAEHTAALVARTDDVEFDKVNAVLQEIDERLEEARADLASRGYANSEVEHIVEARYLFQVWEIECVLPFRRVRSMEDIALFAETFHREHERIFSIRDDTSAIETLNWKGRLSVKLGEPSLERRVSRGASEPVKESLRPAFFGGDAPIETAVYLGRNLDAGHAIPGPAIIVEPTTTIVADKGTQVKVTPAGNYLLELS